MAWAMDKGKDYELEPTVRYTLLLLANYADPEGNDIFPSLGRLEADTGLSERTIRRHIKTLMGIGLLEYGDQEVTKNHPKIRSDQRPKVYRFIQHRDQARGVDFQSFGKLPTANPTRKTPRKGAKNDDRTLCPPVPEAPEPVDNLPTTGHCVQNDRTNDPALCPPNHINQKEKPTPAPAAVDLDAVRALREASRARLEAKGFKITAPITNNSGGTR